MSVTETTRKRLPPGRNVQADYIVRDMEAKGLIVRTGGDVYKITEQGRLLARMHEEPDTCP